MSSSNISGNSIFENSNEGNAFIEPKNEIHWKNLYQSTYYFKQDIERVWIISNHFDILVVLSNDGHFPCINIKGKDTFNVGNIFKGNWNNEIQMEGKGEYYIKDDNVYIVGIWEKGELKYGRVFMPNGNIYEGYIKDSKYNGKGKLILPPDAEYEGFFENNEFKNGKMKWNNGYEYEGDFNGNCLEGKGKLTGPDGDIYEGYFDKSLFHGQGKYIYHNSRNEYDGEFQYGIKKGKGKYIAMNEYTYDGNWDNDIPFGYGKLTTWDNTCILKCTFRAGKIAEEPIYEIGSKDNFNQDNFEIKPEEMKLDTRNLTHLEVPKIEATYKLGGNVSFLDE